MPKQQQLIDRIWISLETVSELLGFIMAILIVITMVHHITEYNRYMESITIEGQYEVI